MTFDSSLAWKQASAAISANREVLLALAGVFFMLPALVLEMFFPQPEPTAAMNEQQIAQLVSDYYVSILPVLIPMVLFQALGTISLLTMLTDRSRPTVGEAIRRGVRGILPYLLAQMLLGLAVGIGGGAVLGVFALSGVPALIGVGVALVLAVVIYAAVRTTLVAPAIAVESMTNPVAALKRSWQLTRGNTLRILGFYALVLVVFLVIAMVVGIIVGIPLSLFAGTMASTIVGAIVSSSINALLALYFVAIIAAVHRQLAGPAPDIDRATFE
ncbi:glycerophosphoryl diester phosphodiesterase membrane domain-containing protein [Novosphingobium album (ex Liu et al. 2023)]|uniref:Glycerophosphoryl diester phosphodiesterase membrane domain-containing protein n=1 Tax=Novosphingobium album (ex Liu et al. 2023) TaxID=3031130 RepID=A0ABT5WQU7_9SPHN|nr:glycerophosphoryl diester phosphodiesterase membrane domain-containing protein [Novosphingobium album (ex Liu et al. 2023)]MDE8652396.1 glycerophosphoryl diester phosphodiesterase membrane domain-containing protein [Novosphingobium album (ex Liu et al. 2023)]